jgi:hypothetical protein
MLPMGTTPSIFCDPDSNTNQEFNDLLKKDFGEEFKLSVEI